MRRQRLHIADKLFYGIIAILVVVLGGLGSIIIHQRVSDMGKGLDHRIGFAANYLEKILPQDVYRLNAKQMRSDIESSASDELQAVEIFDSDNERIYVYERSTSHIVYDRKIDRELFWNGKYAGKMSAYFSAGSIMKDFRIKEFLRLIVLISTAGIVLGAGIYFIANRIILKPVDGILAFSGEVANGNYDKRIDISSGDEMGTLQASLNKMADSLQNFVESLKASFSEAEGARRQAQESSRLKGEFLARMSHETRTPVNAIVGFTDVLLEGECDRERRVHLETIKSSAGILLENINDILDFSKLEAKKLFLDKTTFSLQELLSEITPIVRLRLHGKKVGFEANISEKSGDALHGDRTRIRQVLLNILINAAKFTHSGRIVLTVRNSDDGKGMLFSIRDTGIGIGKEHHARIFEPFVQADGTITREYGGAGLGLAIAKGLVVMMGGRIWLESSPGEGSVFYFTVPTG